MDGSAKVFDRQIYVLYGTFNIPVGCALMSVMHSSEIIYLVLTGLFVYIRT